MAPAGGSRSPADPADRSGHTDHGLARTLGRRLEIIAGFGDERLAFTEPGNEAA
ncbi:MAG TPA: hypothetical protein VKV80_14645 [Streptosporangiaceae bacterium]|jgi:hypothetical protein|nr:hypothetical protein [Streptosporangiaceae bacterium]